MTAKSKKARKSQPAPKRSKTAANPELAPHSLVRQEMAENDMELRFFRLTRRQQAVLPIVALAPSITQAASESGVSQRTLHRWLNDPRFPRGSDPLPSGIRQPRPASRFRANPCSPPQSSPT